MARKAETSDALAILHRRHIKDSPERNQSLQVERLKAQVARLTYDARHQAGLPLATLDAGGQTAGKKAGVMLL